MPSAEPRALPRRALEHSSTYAIETTGLRKTYRTRRGRQVAVAGLDLLVPSGGVHGFLGPNGSGKTTTIRMILGLIRADSGVVRVFDQEVPAALPDVIDRIGAIVEQPKFFPPFSGEKNLRLLAQGIGAPQARVAAVLDEVGLAERGRDKFRTYSLGMKQRLAIAATLLKDPDLLIFDEPTNGLDPAGIHEIRATMRGLAERGKTVLVSSHILSEVQQVADTVSIIGRGRLLAQGDVDEILAAQGGETIRVGVGDAERARQILTDAGFVVAAATERQLTVTVPRGKSLDPARITKALADAGLYVHELTPLRADLESVFLDLTAEEHLGVTQHEVDQLAGAEVIRLLGAEANRLRSRRIALVTLILVILALGAFQLAVRAQAKPPSAAHVAAARAQFDEVHTDWVANHQQREQDCIASGNAADDCTEREPTESDFGLAPTPFSEIGTIAVLLSIYLVALATFIVAGSSIGAEYTSGAISNWLSFIPERGKVFAAKLITITAAGIAFSAVGAALSLGAAALIVRFYGGSLGGSTKLVHEAGRGLAVAAIMAILGFCIGLLARHTAAAIGVLLGYLFVWFVRNAILSQFGWAQRLTPWSPEGNISALVEKGHTYVIPVETVTPEGVSLDYVERTISLTHGATYWGIILAVLIVGSLLVFRRRDVV